MSPLIFIEPRNEPKRVSGRRLAGPSSAIPGKSNLSGIEPASCTNG